MIFKNVAFRLLSRVKSFDSDCWEWTASLDDNGYGQLSVRGSPEKAYRTSYRLHKGPIPQGGYVLHTCDNRKCINPAHLFLGTLQDNLVDMRQKGRGAKGEMFPQAKLTEEDIRLVRRSPESNTTLAKRLDVNQSVISRIRNGKVWRHVT